MIRKAKKVSANQFPRREMEESLQKKRILILFELVKRITK
jgi:hypothetical protein